MGAPCVLGLGALAMFGSHLASSPVSVVRDGVLDSPNSATVGRAFEATFRNTKWTSFEGDKKETVVEFTGNTTVDALLKAHFYPDEGALDDLRPGCLKSLGIESEMDAVNKHLEELNREFNFSGDSRPQLEEVDRQRHEAGQARDVLNEKVDGCIRKLPAPVKFQFVLSADRKRFQIEYFEVAYVIGVRLNPFLDFIYR
jgi:hypothetical protein